jgi:hypothetical protein
MTREETIETMKAMLKDRISDKAIEKMETMLKEQKEEEVKMTRDAIIEKMEGMLNGDNELLYDVTMECDIDIYRQYRYYNMNEIEEFYSTEGRSILQILSDMELMNYSDNYFYIDEVYGYTSFDYLSGYIEKVASYIDIDDVINHIESYGGDFNYISSDFDELAQALYCGEYEDEDEDEEKEEN